jgi:hypothetical protein
VKCPPDAIRRADVVIPPPGRIDFRASLSVLSPTVLFRVVSDGPPRKTGTLFMNSLRSPAAGTRLPSLNYLW